MRAVSFVRISQKYVPFPACGNSLPLPIEKQLDEIESGKNAYSL